MIRRRPLLAGPAALAAFAALSRRGRAQSVAPWLPVSMPTPAYSYVGPGDVFPDIANFWSLRALNGATAAGGTQALCQVQRSQDSATADIIVGSDGHLGVTANATAGSNGVDVGTWGGVLATGTGSISGFNLTFTGGIQGGQVTGAGVLPGTIINGGSSPNWQVNYSQTVASTTLTVRNGLLVLIVYDQVGGRNILNAFGQSGMPLAINVKNGRAALIPDENLLGSTIGFRATLQGQATPYTFEAVAELNPAVNGYATVMTWGSGGGGGRSSIGFIDNTHVYMGPGTVTGINSPNIQVAATSTSLLALGGTFNGASSTIYVNGSGTAGSAGGTAASDFYMGAPGGNSGRQYEFLISRPTIPTAAQMLALRNNQGSATYGWNF